jgi:hypothetical protein
MTIPEERCAADAQRHFNAVLGNSRGWDRRDLESERRCGELCAGLRRYRSGDRLIGDPAMRKGRWGRAWI